MNIFTNFCKTQNRWDNISKLEHRKLVQNHSRKTATAEMETNVFEKPNRT